MPIGFAPEPRWRPGATTRAADRLRLPVLDTEIKQLENAVNALYSERKLIQDRLDSYTYPVMSLPNEIVAEIFVQYLPPYPACPPLLGDGSPTTLAQICSRWRGVAHGTPALWRAIELFVSAPLFEAASFQLGTMQSWLERSGILPLSIIMGDEADNQLCDMALSHLLTRRARWEHGSMPLLLHLDIRYNLSSHLDILFGALRVPRLHTVFLDLHHLRQGRFPQNLPWRQLTKLFLSNTHIEAAAWILRQTTNLLHCRLRLDNSHGASALDSRLFHLTSLETLILEGRFTQRRLVVEFLHTIRAPALKRLHIDVGVLPRPRPPTVLAVVQSFGCKLERLSLEGPKSLDDYRIAFPEMTHLELMSSFDLTFDDWGCWDLQALGRNSRTSSQ
ncbi:hypothetical protein C8F01DRAFT_1098986 [Mycena amicta]|nr:hypothetical protein C8F01DRAFT_1098986 [Mycena amicta]